MKIFGTDGVRGKAGVDITAMVALRLGIAAGLYFQKDSVGNRILVGKDTRRSGYMVENALVSGLTAVGMDVIQVGPMPTPAIAFLTEDMRCDAGIMISASHNPYYDNGIKFFDTHGFKLDEVKESEIESLYHSKNLEEHYKIGTEIGSSRRIDDVIGRYIVHIKNSFPKHLTLQGVRIVLDCANGAAYKVAPSVFEELGADVIVLSDSPNGSNINENCGAMYPNILAGEVKRLRADIGFGLDGDADRLIVVDNEGNLVDGDKLIGALALYQKKNKLLLNNGVVATLMSNIALENFLKQHDIKLERCNVGDKYVLQAMLTHGFNFGGEQSGHIIFSDFAKTGDGLVSALQVAALVLESRKTSKEALNPFDLAPQKQSNLQIKQKLPLDSIQGLKEILKDIESHQIRHLVRYSGTENKIRILLEGDDEAKLETYNTQLQDIFLKTLC
ncbi:phosphoglucosamine mutase [Helicobacter trogontum]|uniref:Phosphoglucosamine mutase n=1 Tax=Helicobacter trogontum TaxID=50960 RepID=A0ABQ0D472_9HELI|nr:phosphoglucosamine mutase [Helicobacter trogontum]MCI5786603.1 phosphoglucosamine mutase [Helicobacter trogontum]MDY5185620.1 phosphoglucosamine mutase [Helicobacter trogontum]